MQFLQVDTHIIDELFSAKDGKKQDSLFKLNRAQKAIRVLLQTNYTAGVSAQASYLSYTGKFEEAINYFNEHLHKYEYVDILLYNYVSLSSIYGEFSQIKYAMNLYLDNVKKLDKSVINNIINWSLIYFDSELLPKLSEYREDLEGIREKIKQHVQKLTDVNISLEVYRKTLFLAHQAYNAYWFGLTITNFDSYDDEIVLRFGVVNASPKDVRIMTDKLNDLILAEKNKEFMAEVSNITAYFCVERDENEVA